MYLLIAERGQRLLARACITDMKVLRFQVGREQRLSQYCRLMAYITIRLNGQKSLLIRSRSFCELSITETRRPNGIPLPP